MWGDSIPVVTLTPSIVAPEKAVVFASSEYLRRGEFMGTVIFMTRAVATHRALAEKFAKEAVVVLGDSRSPVAGIRLGLAIRDALAEYAAHTDVVTPARVQPRAGRRAQKPVTRGDLNIKNDPSGYRARIFDTAATDPDRSWTASELHAVITERGWTDNRGHAITLSTVRTALRRMETLMLPGRPRPGPRGRARATFRVNPVALVSQRPDHQPPASAVKEVIAA